MENKNPILLPDFSDLSVVVIGDIMTDRYISGVVRRISPEAPVHVVDMESTENRPGGAANVAMNLLALGAKVTLLSITGDDNEGDFLNEICTDNGRISNKIIRVSGRKTTVKTRVMAGNQQLLRIDDEDTMEISQDIANIIIRNLDFLMKEKKADGVILQDYNKGLLSEYLIQKIISLCNDNDIPTFVDPKEKNFFAYKGCTVFKPNRKEAQQATGNFNKDYDAIAFDIQKTLSNKITMITLGSEGLFIKNHDLGIKYPTAPRVIADVCGAGDSVISIVGVSYLKGLSLPLIARIANIAGGQVCEKPGVALVNRSDIQKELN